MTTFVSDNPGTPVSDAWDNFYEQVQAYLKEFALSPNEAKRIWVLGVDEFIKKGGFKK